MNSSILPSLIALRRVIIMRLYHEMRSMSLSAMMRSPVTRSLIAAIPLIIAVTVVLNLLENAGPAIGLLAAVVVLVGLITWLYITGTRPE